VKATDIEAFAKRRLRLGSQRLILSSPIL